MRFNKILRASLPPALVNVLQHGRNYLLPARWEVATEGWASAARGWNVESIAESQEQKWARYAESLRGTGYIGVNHEASPDDFNNLVGHNAAMTFGYVLAQSAMRRETLRVLDWGGGPGHYYTLAKALLPELGLDYWSQDVPLLAELGRKVNPEANFFEERDAFLTRRYDLVMAVSSLWYEEDWKALVRNLLSVCDGYFYLSRMVIVRESPTFVALQRPWAAGYKTEYVCWIFNRDELVSFVESCGATLVREFLLDEAPLIHHSRERGGVSGFLFRV